MLFDLTDGTYQFRAEVIDVAGNIAFSNVETVTVDTEAIAGSLELAIDFEDTGLSSGDRISNDINFSIQLFCESYIAEVAYEFSVDGGSTWSHSSSSQANLDDGRYIYRAMATDLAGNTALSNILSITVDTTPPSSKAVISGVGDDVGIIQGIVAASGATDDSTPTISGTLSAALGTGERLQIFNGTTVLGDATVDNTALSWTFTPAGLANTAATTYKLSAKVVDLAGNFGSASASRVFVLDTIAPVSSAAITSVTDNVGGIQGPLAAGAVTDDSTPSLSGTITAALATGESLRIFNGSALLGAAVVNNTLKTWTFTPTALPATSGTPYAISARVADAAGNLGAPSASISFSLDTISNQVNGDANANTLTATNAKDLLTGLGGTDTFSFPSLALSLFPSVDRITDFAIGTDSLKGPIGMTPSKIANLGAVTNFDATAITALLPSSVFMANSAAAFTSLDSVGIPRTYVALNDGIDGFSPASDALVEITGYSGLLGNLLLS